MVPVIAIPLMVKLAVPLFSSVTTLAALLVPIPHVENLRLVGDRVAFGPEITAVLVKAIFCGLPRNRRKPSPCRSCSRIFSGRTPFGLRMLAPCAASVPSPLTGSSLLGVARKA